MNKLLPNGNILAVYGAGDDTLMTSLAREISPDHPEYEGSMVFMSKGDAERALAHLNEYRRKHLAAS